MTQELAVVVSAIEVNEQVGRKRIVQARGVRLIGVCNQSIIERGDLFGTDGGWECEAVSEVHVIMPLDPVIPVSIEPG